MSTKYLAHITTKENCDKIVSTNRFNISVHSKKTNQWLGDGIYFWDANDDSALKVGYRLVKNKVENKFKSIQKISFLVEIDDKKYINLDDDEWNLVFINFLRNIGKEGEQLLEILSTLKSNEYIAPKTLNKIGFMFGNCINLFLKVLFEKTGIEYEVVSHYFYHMTKRNLLSSREELCYRQFCIKNANLVNSINKSNWYIEDIVR